MTTVIRDLNQFCTEWQDPHRNLSHREYYNLYGTLNDWRIRELLQWERNSSDLSDLLSKVGNSYTESDFLNGVINDILSVVSNTKELSETLDAESLSSSVGDELREIVERLETLQLAIGIEVARGRAALEEVCNLIYSP